MVGEIAEVLPKDYRRYYEPFVGGGALFFALAPRSAVLADKNEDLILTYREVRDRPREIIELLRCMKNSELDYYRIRAERPTDSTRRAARFIYLCILAFNGVHRYNQKGEFNVPYGFKAHLEVCEEERILRASARLQRAKLLPWDFEKTLRSAKPGDLIYLDPPYTVAHNNNGFVKYNAAIFSWRDQERLAAAAHSARRRGCYVVVSNADHDCVRQLYKGFAGKVIRRHSVIGGGKNFRRPITEALFWS